jgi:hypothetical protein
LAHRLARPIAKPQPRDREPAPARELEHDAEKWVPVFGKHHAPGIT